VFQRYHSEKHLSEFYPQDGGENQLASKLRHCHPMYIQGGPKKRGHRLVTIILSNLDRFKKKFTGRFLRKCAVKWILKIPPYLAYVATLPCKTLMSAKQAINDKLQGSVATYLSFRGVVNNQIKKGLLLSV